MYINFRIIGMDRVKNKDVERKEGIMNLKQSIEEMIKQPDYEPMSVSDFQDALGLNSADSFRDLIKILVELEQSGLIERTRTDRYQRKQSNKTNSKLIKRNVKSKKKGFAFLRPEDDEMDDIFIPPTKNQ